MSFPIQDSPAEGPARSLDELKERAGLLHSILDRFPDPIQIIDRDFNVVYQNAAALERNGKNLPEPIRNKCHQLFYDRNAPCPFCSASEIVQTLESGRVPPKQDHPRGAGPCFDELLFFPVQSERGEYFWVRVGRTLKTPQEPVAFEDEFANIVGRSRPMKNLFRLIRQVAGSSSTVLIQGESGTGKELVARAIHCCSRRSGRPFVAIDCGALTETLLESELFGHVKGSFTGAIGNKKGLFEEADGGTLFLDEIGDTTPAFQSKLLRMLQESEIRPVGSNKNQRVDVRIIAATQRDLHASVEKKTFREDLYYRLAVVPIVIPPLRERREDIPLLAEHFIGKYCGQNRMDCKRISPQVMQILTNHSWNGNVRELEHTIERAVLMASGLEIGLEALLSEPATEKNSPAPLSQVARAAVETAEKGKIIEAMQQSGGNRSDTAKLLGISRATLYNKLKRYDLTP